MFRSVVVFLAVISVTYAALGMMIADPKPEKFKNVEGCYVKKEDFVVPPSKLLPSKLSCESYSCDPSSQYVSIASCGIAVAPHPCKIVKQTNYILYPHPKCCPTVVCPKN